MNKKTVITIAIILAALGIAFFSYSVFQDRSNNTEKESNHIDVVDDFNDSLETPSTDTSTQNGDENSEGESTPSDTSNDSGSTPAEQQTSKEEIGVVLTRAEQTGQEVVVEGFAQTLRQDGTCTISVRHNDTQQTVTGSTKTSAQPSYVNCSALYLPIDKFKSEGTWVAQITYSNPQETGTSNQIEFEVEL